MILKFENTGDLNDYRYNCRKTTFGARPFRPAIGDLSKVNLFANFGDTRPTSWDIFVIDATKINTAATLTTDTFVVGYNGKYWFGVFKKLQGSIPYNVFLFAIRTPNGTYFSDVYENCDCDDLTHLTVCYPSNYNAEDMNGIYIGAPDETFPIVGVAGVRYTHHAWVRSAEIVETINKMSFVSSRFRNFRSELVKQYELRSEPVASWYKDVLVAIYFRGNIVVDGVERRVNDINFEDIENDRWKAYAVLAYDYKGSFGCTTADCKNGDSGGGSDCVEPQIEDVPLGPYKTFRHYVQLITVSGTNPIVMFNKLPDWMTGTVQPGVILLEGSPTVAGTYEIEIVVTNACGYDIREETVEVIYEECQSVGFTIPATLPNGVPGQNYFVSYPLDGTEPFDLVVNSKPAWMEIGIGGGTVYLSGIPPAAEDWQNVSFSIGNCSGEFSIPYNGYIKVWAICEEYYNNTSLVQIVHVIECQQTDTQYNVPIYPGQSICVNPGDISGPGAGYLINLGQC